MGEQGKDRQNHFYATEQREPRGPGEVKGETEIP